MYYNNHYWSKKTIKFISFKIYQNTKKTYIDLNFSNNSNKNISIIKYYFTLFDKKSSEIYEDNLFLPDSKNVTINFSYEGLISIKDIKKVILIESGEKKFSYYPNGYWKSIFKWWKNKLFFILGTIYNITLRRRYLTLYHEKVV